MTLPPGDFFPNDANWPFREAATGAVLTLNLRSHTEPQGRVAEFSASPDQAFRAFFDRMTITAGSLELNRIRLGAQTVDIRPPLAVTTDNAPNHVANLLPGVTFSVGLNTAPYDGTVTDKAMQPILPQAPFPGDTMWGIKIFSRSVATQGILMRIGILLSRSHGLVMHVGDFYGGWFIYQRTDLAPSPLTAFIDQWQHHFLNPKS
jgi:hypothetical protein